MQHEPGSDSGRSLGHKNLGVAIGAAMEQARGLLHECRRRGTTPSDRWLSVYLELILIHRQVSDPDPLPMDSFVPELRHAILECDASLGVVKSLLEAALGVARDVPDAP